VELLFSTRRAQKVSLEIMFLVRGQSAVEVLVVQFFFKREEFFIDVFVRFA